METRGEKEKGCVFGLTLNRTAFLCAGACFQFSMGRPTPRSDQWIRDVTVVVFVVVAIPVGVGVDFLAFRFSILSFGLNKCKSKPRERVSKRTVGGANCSTSAVSRQYELWESAAFLMDGLVRFKELLQSIEACVSNAS